jgi:uncharacterized heparinase superfamily protein
MSRGPSRPPGASATERLLRYYHTLRPLRVEQIAFRPVEMVRRRAYKGLPGLGALHTRARGSFPGRPLFGVDATRPLSPRAQAVVEDVRSMRATFVGQTGTANAWQGAPGCSRLWTYNLNYLEWLIPCLLAGERELVRARLADFFAQNPVGLGPAWEPYPAALRTVALVYLATLGGRDLLVGLADRIAAHGSFVRWNLERHLLGNHLLKDLKALAIAWAFLDHPRTDVAIAHFAGELEAEVLADGGHFERSPMYHSLALADAIEVAAVARATGRLAESERLQPIIERMRRFLLTIVHPDGEIPCLSDAGTGVAPSPAALLDGSWDALFGAEPAAVPEPPEGIHHLRDTGLLVVRQPDVFLVLDAGELGASYLPGHGHSDALTYELSLGGDRVVVDSGVRTYAPSPERDADRAGPAHNSVTVDGEGPDELWSAFRAARRSTILEAEVQPWHAGARISAAVRSYRGWIHRRQVYVVDRVVAVVDRIEGAARGETHIHTLVPYVRTGGFKRRSGTACLQFGVPGGCTILTAPVGSEGASYVVSEREDVAIEGRRLRIADEQLDLSP